MRKAANLEASTEKHPITPGEVLPAQELLADMLLDLGRYQEAQTEYEASLDRGANRCNSLYGAGRATELRGDKQKAAFYYKKLIEISAKDSKQDKVRHAKDFVELRR